MSVGVPAVIIAAVLYGEIYPPDESGMAINNAAFLMKRLGEVPDVATAIVEKTIHSGSGEQVALLRGVVGDVAAKVEGIPEEHSNSHATAGREAEHIYHTQAISVPQRERFIVQTVLAQACEQLTLARAVVGAEPHVIAAHHRQLDVDIPARQQDVLPRAEECAAHRQHGGMPIHKRHRFAPFANGCVAGCPPGRWVKCSRMLMYH